MATMGEMMNNSTQYLAQTIDDFWNFFNPNSNNYSKLEISSPIDKTYKKEDFLVIEIKDNARGIKEDIINKIFDAYFTTKENNQGTGTGLHMSKDILTKLLDAQISVENDTFTYENIQYKGAKFIIKLPLS